MRQVLCCLYRFFVLHREAYERIFSDLFREHLAQHGFQGRIPYRSLHAQWAWMRRTESAACAIWFHVHKNTEFRTDADWQTKVGEIKAAADRLGLRLIEKERDDIDTSNADDSFDVSEHPDEYLESLLLSVRNYYFIY